MVVAQALRFPKIEPEQTAVLAPCEHRVVSKTGRILCSKINEGDNLVSPGLCGSCPFAAINCSHVRFMLRRTSPSPLIVRFNGREEIWDDRPPEILFEQAACAVKVMPITNPKQCAGCALHQACAKAEAASTEAPAHTKRRQYTDQSKLVAGGNVVPFPLSDLARAAG